MTTTTGSRRKNVVVEHRRGRPKLSASEVEEICRLRYEEEMRILDIARRIGCSDTTVKTYLKDNPNPDEENAEPRTLSAFQAGRAVRIERNSESGQKPKVSNSITKRKSVIDANVKAPEVAQLSAAPVLAVTSRIEDCANIRELLRRTPPLSSSDATSGQQHAAHTPANLFVHKLPTTLGRCDEDGYAEHQVLYRSSDGQAEVRSMFLGEDPTTRFRKHGPRTVIGLYHREDDVALATIVAAAKADSRKLQVIKIPFILKRAERLGLVLMLYPDIPYRDIFRLALSPPAPKEAPQKAPLAESKPSADDTDWAERAEMYASEIIPEDCRVQRFDYAYNEGVTE